MNHGMAIRADDRQLADGNSSFASDRRERPDMVNVRKMLPDITIFGLKVESAAWDFAQEAAAIGRQRMSDFPLS